MHICPVALYGAHLIELDKRQDGRGFFARMFCENEFAEAKLHSKFVQANNSWTSKRGTLRGFHFQLPPAAEVKVVRCVRGAIFDVIVDLRPGSPTYLKWFGTELTAENRTMMYVPPGCGHAFLTLVDDTEVLYLVSAAYASDLERGVRFDDPTLAVDWPFQPTEISARDASLPHLQNMLDELEELSDLR